MNKRTFNFLFHPATIAFFIFVVIIIFLPPFFNRYQASIIENRAIHEPDIYSYYDLNNDGISEEIWYFGAPYYPTFIVRNNGKIINQWNFSGTYIGGDVFYYCDYDKDSITEIFTITILNDSIFITGVNPYKFEEKYFFKSFFDKCSKYNNLYDCAVEFCDAQDINNDGFKELVFSVQTGLTKQPRNLYVVDINKKSVKKSPESGTSIISPISFDLDNDGYNEYMGRCSAFGNFDEDSIDYPDTHAWNMVIDKNMNLLFEPQQFGQFKTTLDLKPFSLKTSNYLLALQTHIGHENIQNKLMLFDISGRKVRERVLDEISGVEGSFLLATNKVKFNELYLFINNEQILQIDSNLNFRKTLSIPGVQNMNPAQLDIDLDGKDEFIFMSDDLQGIVITRNDFSNPVKVEFENNMEQVSYYSLIKNIDKNPNLFIQFKRQGLVIDYSKNPLYSLKYLIWAAIYGIVFLFIFLLQKVQNIRATRKFKTEQLIAELQLKSIKGQTDPHFTLNLIDSIGNLFYKQDSEKASYVFGKYAKLLRTTILSSEKIAVSLGQEIEYVKNYLELEKFRFDGKFQYSIEIDEDADAKVHIPKMLLHTFVENAIKHGLKHKEGKGNLEIKIKKKNKFIEVKIKDDGVGRTKAKEYSKMSTKQGLHILDKMLDLYRDLKNIEIVYTITDLASPENISQGTMVVIAIPVKEKK